MGIPLRRYWVLLSRYIEPQRRRVLLLALLIFASIGLQLAGPQIQRYFIDAALAGAPLRDLLRAALVFIALAVVQQGASVAATYFSENVGWTATNALRSDLMRHCLHLDMAFHNKRTPGEMIERIDGDVLALSNFFSQFTIQVAGNVLLLAAVLALLFREDWRVGIALTVFVVVALLLMNRLRSIAVPHWTAARQASAELFGFLEERLAGTEDIRSCGAKAYVMRRFYELMRSVMRRQLRAGLMAGVVSNSTAVLFATGNAVALAAGAYVYGKGLITIGTVYLIYNYTTLISRPLRAVSQQLEDLQRAGAGIGRAQELLGTRGQIASAGQRLLPGGPLSVRFDGVSFGYGEEAVLHDVTLDLAPGQVLGLLGRTGAGKTTISRLLFHLYDVDRGTILLGGEDVRELEPADLRRRVGLVTQNVELFHATLRDNLTFFDRSVDDERILQVIGELGLWRWYEAQPAGLDTEIGAGAGLSSGEAQLLALTRVFLRDPGLVILDEASSRLDPATERLLDAAIARLMHGRTGIVIAHRLSTVQKADAIAILEDERVVEQGERPGLAADPASRFHRLLQTGLEEVLA